MRGKWKFTKLFLKKQNFISPKRLIQAGLYKRFEQWKKNQTDNEINVFEDRYQMYEFINKITVCNEPIDYLEFGVFQGQTIEFWANINNNYESRFFGFDSFKGLPEDWGDIKAGAWDLKGKVPVINDKRVELIAGWFQKTLPPFLNNFTPNNRLIIHFDADLYSSTLFSLSCMDKLINNGSILIFDEFARMEYEFRAFIDYADAYWKKYRVICHTPNYYQIALLIK